MLRVNGREAQCPICQGGEYEEKRFATFGGGAALTKVGRLARGPLRKSLARVFVCVACGHALVFDSKRASNIQND